MGFTFNLVYTKNTGRIFTKLDTFIIQIDV